MRPNRCFAATVDDSQNPKMPVQLKKKGLPLSTLTNRNGFRTLSMQFSTWNNRKCGTLCTTVTNGTAGSVIVKMMNLLISCGSVRPGGGYYKFTCKLEIASKCALLSWHADVDRLVEQLPRTSTQLLRSAI